MLQRKKPLMRKKALRAKAPLKAAAAARPFAAADHDRTDTGRTETAARKLWPLLEQRCGPPFVADERIGPYRADFACPAAKLVILIDNGDDPARRDWFAAQAWRVLSFAAAEIAAAPERVLDAVADCFSLRIVKR
jgi:very-short-patch-repair endonuclease